MWLQYRSQNFASVVKMWLQKQICSSRSIKVAARADKELPEPIHDYWSHNVTGGAMMWLQEQYVASGVKMLLQENPFKVVSHAFVVTLGFSLISQCFGADLLCF